MESDVDYVSYVSGLFDGGGNIYFRISKSNRDLGYRINPTVIIHLDRKDELYGFLDEFLVSKRIQFKISQTDTGARRLEIDTRVNVERFLEMVREETIQHSEAVEFILEELYPARDKGNILECEEFLRMVETIELMQPRRRYNNSVKYTTDFFYSTWSVEKDYLPYDVSPRNDVRVVSEEYVAGFFDGAGKIRPVIHESDSTELGFSASLRLGMTRSWLRNRMLESLEKFMKDRGIKYNINKQDSRVSLHVTNYECIEEFVRNVQPYLVANFEISAMTCQKVIPAFRDEYHKTRQGLHDIVELYEMVMDCGSERKYTSEFFERQWDSVTPLQTE